MSTSAVDIATKLARALDAEDYDAARGLLDVACRYTGGPDGEIIGPQAIVDSYRNHGAQANESRFDEIIFSSEVAAGGPNRATITYLDRLRLGKRWHEHRCAQHVEVGPSGRIIAIQHQDLPGEVDALRQWESESRKAKAESKKLKAESR
jgi:hypothetical protein